MQIEASAGRSKKSVTVACYRLVLKAESVKEAADLSALFHLFHRSDIGLYECIDRELRAAAVEARAAKEAKP